MSLQPILKYPLDLSGMNPNNLVVGEYQSLPESLPNRTIAPYYGAFFTQGLVIKNLGFRVEETSYTPIQLTGPTPLIIGSKNISQLALESTTGYVYIRLSNQEEISAVGFYKYEQTGYPGSGNYTLTLQSGGVTLTPGVDYVPTMLHQEATRISGKEVCQLIVITQQSILGDLTLEYQAVGGEYSVSSDALEDLIATLQLDQRPVVWAEIIGLPTNFPPVDHIHHIQNFYGWGHIINELDNIKNLLAGGLTVGGNNYSIIYVGAEAPANPADNMLWWDNVRLRLYLYYVDGPSTSFWVEISGSGGTGTAPGGGSNEDVVTTLYSSAGVLNIDLSLGKYFKHYLTEDVTEINILNPSARAEFKVDFQQNATNVYQILTGYPASFKWQSGALEVATGLNSHSMLTATSFDSGVRWQAELLLAWPN